MNNYEFDIYRYYGKIKNTFWEKLTRPNGLKYMILWRKYQKSNFFVGKLIYKIFIHNFRKKTMLQIPTQTIIGKGFYIGHDGPIVINPEAILGNNVNIAKGVVIGQTNRGKKKGVPIIGNNVWIGSNAVIVGKIIIKDDVLIAPNAYVNFDVPEHSIVVGNPGVIHHRENATEGYINRTV